MKKGISAIVTISVGIMLILLAVFLIVYYYEQTEKAKHLTAQNEQLLAAFAQNDSQRNLAYTLAGQSGIIQVTLNPQLNQYLAGLNRSISYKKGTPPPTTIDFVSKKINNTYQHPFLKEVVNQIQNMNISDDDKVRVAVSLVQQIPYDVDGYRTEKLTDKYPYEVLYTYKGVCGEKSELLLYFLRELGYGTAYFTYDTERHAAVGIKCAQEKSYLNSGYCFIETTAPSLIGDFDNEYENVGFLHSTPTITLISNGKEFSTIDKEISAAKFLQIAESDSLAIDEESYKKLIKIREEFGLSQTTCAINEQLCNGFCYKPCATNMIFRCLESGGLCEYDPTNCPSHMHSCGQSCYEQCERGTFACKDARGICYI